MKKLFWLLLFSGISASLQAQDLIVTRTNDSINCLITKVKSDYIYFTFQEEDRTIKTLLPEKHVKYHQKNFFYNSRIPLGGSSTTKSSSNALPLKVAFSGGWSYRTGPVADGLSPDEEAYIKDLKSGYSLSADIIYYPSESFGVGIKYSRHRSSNEMENHSRFGKVEDDVAIHYVGPMFSARFPDGTSQNIFFTNLSLGYTGYVNNARAGNSFILRGSTAGFAWDIGYDFGLSESTALGLQLSFFTGILKEIDLGGGGSGSTVSLPKENYENLSRIDLTVGIRFNQ